MRAALLACALAACTTEPRAATTDAAVADAGIKVACDGALCDTTNHSTCSAGAPTELAWIALPLAVIARRRRRR